MTVRKWLKTPKGYVTLVLIMYLVIASIGYKEITGILHAIMAVLVSVFAETLVRAIKKEKWAFPYSAIITGLIISSILSSSSPLGVVCVTSLMAVLSKYILIYKKKHIFNPAVMGLLLSQLLYHSGQSWWGAFGDLPGWTLLLLILGGYLITGRVNKFPMVFTFLGVSFVLMLLIGFYNPEAEMEALRPPFINAILFFGFIMLTDPPTSPAKDKDQIIYGLLTAVVGTAVYGLFGGLNYLFIGLILANGWNCLKKARSKSTAQRITIRTQHR
ncbi:RnfABCDGE type electron transport complex subunit D [Peribacillus kribbensis]|uniref:RnfABCDGE type electron transport complex subunit D n=1 Tax=Peribacillus kribbensis TaxID=356658 RepID=UPI0004280D5C|nr:RnfABCDGE type electron transport complex subunit D [Peribacillus kribbensis]